MKRKLAELLNVIFGFRKFILMLFLIVIGIVFRVTDLINGAEMVDLLKATAIAFMGANGVEHLVAFGREAMAVKMGGSTAPTGVADTEEENDQEDVEVK